MTGNLRGYQSSLMTRNSEKNALKFVCVKFNIVETFYRHGCKKGDINLVHLMQNTRCVEKIGNPV